MAQTPETKVKKFVDEFMKTHFKDIWRYSPSASIFGNSGVPDRLYLWKGLFIAIEVKADSTKHPTELQLKQLNHIKNQGGISVVIRGKDINKMNTLKSIILERTNHVE